MLLSNPHRKLVKYFDDRGEILGLTFSCYRRWPCARWYAVDSEDLAPVLSRLLAVPLGCAKVAISVSIELVLKAHFCFTVVIANQFLKVGSWRMLW